MPELPEVHNFKRYFDETALDKHIEAVDVHDDFIIRNTDGDTFDARLRGQQFVGSLRRGKYLFCQLKDGSDVLLHFGMTGDILLYEVPEERPKFERFAFVFEDGSRLGFDDPRKFARILYLNDREEYIREIDLGPDALEISEEDFMEALRKRSGSVKGFLMNQHILSGIGNLYADEICYRARVHPASRVAALHDDARKALFRHLRETLTYAVDNSPYYKEYPDNWMWKSWRKEGQTSPEGSGIVRKTKIAGRTTYYCEEWQVEYK